MADEIQSSERNTMSARPKFLQALFAAIKAAPAEQRAALAQAIDDYGPGADDFALKASRALARNTVRPVALFALLAGISDACRDVPESQVKVR